jgi:hypothetical protein
LTIVAAAADFGNRALAVARRYTASSAGSPSGSGLHAAPVATDISTSEAPTSRSFRWRRPETTHRRSIGNLALPETVVCSPTASRCAGTRTCAEAPAKLCRDQTSRPTEHDRSDQRLKRYARTLVTRCPKKHRCRRWFTLGCTGTGRPRAGQSAAHVSAFLV